LAVGGAVVGAGQSQPAAPDNTKVNKDHKDTATADQGKNNQNDRTIMQKIRESVMADKSLSTYAHNVKIVSQNGQVTLKGPVRSEAEKTTIEQKAVEVAGAGKVTNELTIKPSKSKRAPTNNRQQLTRKDSTRRENLWQERTQQFSGFIRTASRWRTR